MIALLYNIRSLHNVGSIFRTADAAGIEKIYLCGITPEPVDIFGKPRTQLTKVSLGAEKSVSWEHVSKTGTLIARLKKEGYKIIAIEQSKKSEPYYKLPDIITDYSRACFIVGHEVKGLPPSILEKADIIVEIPMFGKKESLNVAVAFGIVIFRLKEKI